MRPLRGVLVFVVAVGVVVALLAVGIAARRPISRPLAYWVIDDRTIGIVVIDSPGIRCDVARVDESADTVRIYAECFEPLLPIPMAGAAHLNVLQVDLQTPLANRTILDGLGNVGTLCEKPAPDCLPPLP